MLTNGSRESARRPNNSLFEVYTSFHWPSNKFSACIPDGLKSTDILHRIMHCTGSNLPSAGLSTYSWTCQGCDAEYMGANPGVSVLEILMRTSGKEGLGFSASSWVMSSLISALTSLLADKPRSVPKRESSSCACFDPQAEIIKAEYMKAR